MRVYANQGDTVDLLCWRHLGRTAGVTEQVLEANRGLSALGPVLPHGTPVELPQPQAVAPQVLPLVQLWS